MGNLAPLRAPTPLAGVRVGDNEPVSKADHPHHSPVKATRLELILLAVGLIVVAACVMLIDPLREAFQHAVKGDTDAVKSDLDRLGVWGVVIVFALAQIHAVVWFPSEILDAAAGFVYGFWPALAMLMIFWTISALIAYWIGHSAARPLLYKLAGEERFRKAEALIHRGGAVFLLTARLVPIIPFSLLSIVAGAAKVPVWTFTWTTAIGYIPLTAYFVYLGSQIEGFSLTDPIVWIGAIGFVIAVFSVRRVLRQASPESS